MTDSFSHYKLVGKMPVPCSDLREWSEWMKEAEASEPNLRRVGLTTIGLLTVYTTFLGIDHSFSFSGRNNRPVLFETMIHSEGFSNLFHGSGWLNYQERYHTWEEAEGGHKRAVIYANAMMEKINQGMLEVLNDDTIVRAGILQEESTDDSTGSVPQESGTPEGGETGSC